MSKTLLALYGLKYNPFVPGVPTEALQVSPRIDSFVGALRSLPSKAASLSSPAIPAPASRPPCASSPSIWRTSATLRSV